MGEVTIGIEDIERILPHRPPFLFVDRVISLDPGERILAERALRADEPHFKGHFPGTPVMPGVLITEALAQTSGLLHAFSTMEAGTAPTPGRIFYLARADMKWTSPCGPGETLLLESKLVRRMGGLFAFRVKAATRDRDVAQGTLTLAEAPDRAG